MSSKFGEEDERHFEDDSEKTRSFSSSLLQEPLRTLPNRTPIILAAEASPTEAVRLMHAKHRGLVLITKDGTAATQLIGIFTDRDVMNRIVDRGRNPATIALSEVMTPDPDCLRPDSTIAWVLNKMAVGGFRHVPIVDEDGRPVFVVSVRDVVELLVEFFPNEVLNLPPRPDYDGPRSTTREGA